MGDDPCQLPSRGERTTRREAAWFNTLPGSAIIIAASGMCEAGRVVHHLRNNVEDEKNTILIVGFQAQHTLGRRIVERRSRIRILGVERDLRAQVEVLHSFSAHADKNELLDFSLAAGPTTRRFFLVHGEPEQQAALRQEMGKRGLSAINPQRGEEVRLA